MGDRIKARLAAIGACFVFFLNAGLQVSGYQNIFSALASWGVAGLLGLYWLKLVAAHSERGKMIVGVALLILGCAIGVVGLSIVASGGRIFALEKLESEAFSVGRSVYAETRSVRTTDGSDTGLYENRFYLIVGNNLKDGRTLKRTQARILGYETPTLLSTIKETTASETDIRDGELAYFFIGRIISSKNIGHYKGITTLKNERFLPEYQHNIPIGALTFEVWSSASEKEPQFGLNQWPNRAFVWPITVVVSADDVKSLRVILKVNLDNEKSSVSFDDEQ
jgi:hypothetical protein